MALENQGTPLASLPSTPQLPYSPSNTTSHTNTANFRPWTPALPPFQAKIEAKATGTPLGENRSSVCSTLGSAASRRQARSAVRQQQPPLSAGHRWSQWPHSATRGSAARRVFYVCTGKPKLGDSRIAMTVQAVLSATSASLLPTSRWRCAADSQRAACGYH